MTISFRHWASTLAGLAALGALLTACAGSTAHNNCAAPASATYTHVAINCASCDLQTQVRKVLGDAGTDCGLLEDWRRDAGSAVTACVDAHLDAGIPFVVYRFPATIDSYLEHAYVRDGDGLLHLYEVAGSSLPYKCLRRLSESRCDSLDTASETVRCVGESSQTTLCNERDTATVMDAGERPVSELHCPSGGYYCSLDPAVIGPPPGVVTETLVCTDSDYGGVLCEQRGAFCTPPSKTPVTPPTDAG